MPLSVVDKTKRVERAGIVICRGVSPPTSLVNVIVAAPSIEFEPALNPSKSQEAA